MLVLLDVVVELVDVEIDVVVLTVVLLEVVVDEVEVEVDVVVTSPAKPCPKYG